MTKQKSFKERIRARMEKTGESYATARRQLVEKAEAEARKRRTPQTIASHRPEGVEAKTGRTWESWFALLDEWGATGRKHPEVVRWLTGELDVDGWWAQSVTVAYEQARGMRAPGQRADGMYAVSASKTVSAPVDELFRAFADESLRSRWLGDHELTVRTTRPGVSITAVWEGGPTRLTIAFIDKGETKSTIALDHGKIETAREADELKAFWREALVALKEMLEG